MVKRWYAAWLCVLYAVALAAAPIPAAAEPRPAGNPLAVCHVEDLPVGHVPVANMCKDEAWRLGVSFALCLAGTIGYFKAAKVARTVARSLRRGADIKSAILGGLGAFLCADTYTSLWDYLDCLYGMQSQFLSALDSREYLADVFDRMADHLEGGRLPPADPEMEIV